jgi:hypothetical protein
VYFYHRQSIEFTFEELFDKTAMKVARKRGFNKLDKHLPVIYIPYTAYAKYNGKWKLL